MTTRLELAQRVYPHFEWQRYFAATTRQAAVTRLALAGDGNRRLGSVSVQPIKQETLTVEEKALITQGDELVKTIRTFADYEHDVQVAYAQKYGELQRRAIAQIAWHFKLNPNPGLDLLYVWPQDGKLMIHISYKAWLAMALRYKKFVHSYRRLSDDEAAKRGNVNPGDIVVLCEVIDFDTVEKLSKLKALGMDIDLNDDKYKVVGVGVWRKGDQTPKGRDAEWVAMKRATKDAMSRLIAASFNLQMPDVPGYDTDSDSWIIENSNYEDDGSYGSSEESTYPDQMSFDE